MTHGSTSYKVLITDALVTYFSG